MEELKDKKMNKKILIILGLAIFAVSLFLLIGNGEEEISFTTVEKGSLTQEIFETGSTEKGEDVSLGFKEGGRVSRVLVEEGRNIERGGVIAELDREDLLISLREAEAGLSLAEANLEKILTGASEEDLDVARSGVRSAETALVSAKNNLREQENLADESLRTAYQDVTTLLGDVFSSVKEIEIEVRDIADTYFQGIVVSETTLGRRSRDEVRRETKKIESYKDLVMDPNMSFQEKREVVENTEKSLRKLINEIDNLISVSTSDFYDDRFSDLDKEKLRSYRGTLNTALGRVVSLLGSISSVRAEVNASLTSARGAVSSAESTLEQAERELSRVSVGAQDADLRSARATVDQAKTRVELAENRLKNAVLRSPVSGTVSSVLVRGGEVVSPGASVAVVSPDEDIQITIDVYEGDVAKIQIGNEVSASFVAFPGEEFEGEVVFVNPSGKMIDRVVYYQVKIVLDNYPENILPQMTVDVTIKTAQKDNVLLLPERAVRRRDGKDFVSVMENGEVVEREVKKGLSGEGRIVEIISGVEEGEKVVTD